MIQQVTPYILHLYLQCSLQKPLIWSEAPDLHYTFDAGPPTRTLRGIPAATLCCGEPVALNLCVRSHAPEDGAGSETGWMLGQEKSQLWVWTWATEGLVCQMENEYNSSIFTISGLSHLHLL